MFVVKELSSNIESKESKMIYILNKPHKISLSYNLEMKLWENNQIQERKLISWKLCMKSINLFNDDTYLKWRLLYSGLLWPVVWYNISDVSEILDAAIIKEIFPSRGGSNRLDDGGIKHPETLIIVYKTALRNNIFILANVKILDFTIKIYVHNFH